MTQTLLFFDPAFLQHAPGDGHPESPARLVALRSALSTDPIDGTSWRAPRPATEAEVGTVHDAGYVAGLAALDGRSARLDDDTAMSPGTWDAALRGAGASIQAAEEVWAGRARNAFVLCRPPGHHAEVARAMGFCLLNNAAIAAAAARAQGAARVAILDWDVHHGNGTQHLFEDRRDVLYLSVHQSPLYPGTGAAREIGRGAGAGFTINCPLPPGQTDADYGAVFTEIVLPALDRFAPELVIISAGFDAHARDPLAQMALSERGFAAMCAAVIGMTPKAVLLLEGGYDVDALAASARACVEVLAGRTETFPPGPGARVPDAIAKTRAAHGAGAWPLLR